MPTSRFVWYELLTTDLAAADAFYRKVVGWTSERAAQAEPVYHVMSAPTGPAAGIMELPEALRAAGRPPHWLGYVGVADVDAAARSVEQGGGKVHRKPADIPSVGRFAVVADPQGAIFALFAPEGGEGEATAPGPGPGQGGWNELFAADGPGAFDFYSTQFGWTKDRAVDMGEMGIYQLFAAGGPAIGGIMTKPPQIPTPVWQYYFNVRDIDKAVGLVTANGGQVLMGPMQVPGGSWIAQCVDPQGAHFAVVGPNT
jgi:predicted enzyme related to lactoylglutathione lyase